MAKKKKYTNRELMELAIAVMRKSLHEPRDDKKPPPKVGAVLYKADGTIETACRGELRWGDHAEFTLLERKNRHNALDGAKLFATLEPCAPGSRKEPKRCCAERIINARIKEVWVGIEDPDPTVDRKGIKHLLDNGVTVKMFDPDLQEIIKRENAEFFSKALERKAVAEVKAKEPAQLSPLENPEPEYALQDLSRAALDRYRQQAGIEDPIGSDAFNRRLKSQGLLQNEGNRVVASGFGVLLFGKRPREIMPQAGLLATIRYPSGDEETRDFDGPLVEIPEQVQQWLRDKLPHTIDRSTMQRENVPALPYELVREAVVNALVHRDYDIKGAKCQLIVTPETLLISSPGGPVAPIEFEQLQAFNAPMLSRNPILHYVFGKMGYAEERGLGMRSLREKTAAAGLPLPRYSWNAPYLALTIYRTSQAAIATLPSGVGSRLSKTQRKGWEWLSRQQVVTSKQYASALQLPERTALNHLQHFTKLQLVRRVGSGPATEYHLMSR
jgi:ATP-dependent DNA helicase RecG